MEIKAHFNPIKSIHHISSNISKVKYREPSKIKVEQLATLNNIKTSKHQHLKIKKQSKNKTIKKIKSQLIIMKFKEHLELPIDFLKLNRKVTSSVV